MSDIRDPKPSQSIDTPASNAPNTQRTPEEKNAHRERVLHTALEYAANGLCVIPLTAHDDPHATKAQRGKAPRIKAWQETRLKSKEIERCFKHLRNLGIITGKASGIICIDVDPRNGGDRWLLANEDRIGRCIRETTGSGGTHLFYRYPDEDRLKEMGRPNGIPSATGQDGIAPGVELLADGGHQVATWPSIHPNGQPYVVHREMTLVDVAHETDEPPEWILALLGNREPRILIAARTNDAQADRTFANDPMELQRAKSDLNRHGPAIQGRSGDRHTYEAAAIGYRHAIPIDTWRTELRRWNNACQPPWDDRDLEIKLRSAYGRKQEPGKACAANDFKDVVPLQEIPKASECDGSSKKNDSDSEDATTQEKKTKWTFENPLRCARMFLSEHNGVISSRGRHFIYSDDTWGPALKEDLKQAILLEMIRRQPRANILPKHSDDVYRHVSTLSNQQGLAFDRWRDGRKGDYVRLGNGIFDLNKIELLSHTPEWISTTKLSFDYDPNATCPTFESFLNRIWADTPDQIEALQLWMGYMLSSDMTQQAFALLKGPPRAGKGTITDVMTSMVGESNYLSRTVDHMGSRFALGSAIGKKLLLVPDAQEGTGTNCALTAEKIKMITGQDPIPIEEKGDPIVSARLNCKIVLAANDFPGLIDIRGAIIARMICFNFSESFEGIEDFTLGDRIQAEMPGIMNWAIRGLHKLKTIGRLPRPESSKSTVDEIRDVMNPTEAFIRDTIEYSNGDSLSTEDAYEVYRAWTSAAGHKPVSRSKLTSCIRAYFGKHRDVVRERIQVGSGHGGRSFRMALNNLRLTQSVSDVRPQSAASAFATAPADADDDLF